MLLGLVKEILLVIESNEGYCVKRIVLLIICIIVFLK